MKNNPKKLGKNRKNSRVWICPQFKSKQGKNKSKMIATETTEHTEEKNSVLSVYSGAKNILYIQLKSLTSTAYNMMYAVRYVH